MRERFLIVYRRVVQCSNKWIQIRITWLSPTFFKTLFSTRDGQRRQIDFFDCAQTICSARSAHFRHSYAAHRQVSHTTNNYTYCSLSSNAFLDFIRQPLPNSCCNFQFLFWCGWLFCTWSFCRTNTSSIWLLDSMTKQPARKWTREMWQVDECSTAGVGESSGFGYQKYLFVFSVFNFQILTSAQLCCTVQSV